MNKLLKFLCIVGLLVILVQKKPTCVFPEQTPQLREANLGDIQDRINKISSGPLWLYHQGSSMYPTIKDGHACLCVESNEPYKKGEIISYYRLEEDNTVTFVTHRIEDITPYGYITKGDNNPRIDYRTIPPQNVFCKIEEKSLLNKLMRGNE